jgi:UDP-glucuronate decarboxylase
MASLFNKIVKEDVLRVLSVDLPWEDLSGSRIVLTGATGFLGSNILRTLLMLHREGLASKPLEIICLARDIDRARHRLSNIFSNKYVHWLQCDLAANNIPDLGSPDYIIHAASQASPRFYLTDPVGTILPNAIGTMSLLKASHSVRRFLYISSAEVYGSWVANMPICENNFGPIDPVNLRSCYSESKRLGESICSAWHHQMGLHTIIVRLFHTYGPGIDSNDGRVFADFAYAIAHNKPIRITSDGSARRAFCYSSDAISGLFTALLKGEPAQAYNLGNPYAESSILELAQMLQRNFSTHTSTIELSSCSPSYLPSAVSAFVPNIERMRALGWHPTIGLLEGFSRFIFSIS